MDLSLRANHDTYIDRDDESDRILNRIDNDSSTVIGISGLRGAGKSSLAKKTLNNCSKSGYFTLLIHSPSGYDSREFLITIYSSICESVIRKLENNFGIDNTLEGKAESIKKEIRKTIRFMFFGGILLSLATFGILYFAYTKQLDNRYLEQDKELFDQESTLEKRLAELPNSAIDTSYSYNKADYDSINYNILSELDSIKAERKYLERRIKYSRTKYIADSGTTALMGILFYAILIIGYLIIKPKLRLRRRISKNPKEYGLYKIAQENLEYLKFQSTLSDSKEVQASIWKITSKLTKNKSLQTRPISLPGLTSDLSVFLNFVSEVFGSKVVVCLDELDKISDSVQLENLLIGIKGILGQKNVHFLLTVSEDALSDFVNRLRGERNLIESSFEEIVHLGRINHELAIKIIETCAKQEEILKTDTSNTNHRRNQLLLWMFSGGIPRELKRNLLKLRDAEINFVQEDSFTIWRFFYLQLLTTMKDWILISKFSEDEKKDSLILVDNIIKNTPKEIPSKPKEVFTDLISLFNTYKGIENLDFFETSLFDDSLLEKSFLEVLVSSMFIYSCMSDEEKLLIDIPIIQKYITHIPYSTKYTKSEIRKYLSNNNWLQQCV